MTPDLPLVTVVIPVYNGARYLIETLDSVARQTYPRLEVVISDDGSTDDSVAVAAAHPVGAKVLQHANAGNAVARNRGVLQARGEWIAFLDQDDLWHREHVSRTLAAARSRSSSMAASRIVSFVLHGDDAGDRASWADRQLDPTELASALDADLDPVADRPVRLMTPLDVAVAGAPVPSAVVVRRDVLVAAGGFPSVFVEPADAVAWYQVSRLTTIVVAPHATVLYRTHGAAASEGSEKEVRALSAFAAMFYGGTLSPHRGEDDHDALVQHGQDNAVHKLRYLLSEAGRPGQAWRLDIAVAFARLLVDDAATRRTVAGEVRRRRLEQVAPRAVAAVRAARRARRAG